MPGYCYSVLFIFVLVITLSFIWLHREMLLKRSDEDGHSHFEARVAMYGMHSPCLLAHTLHRKYITKSVHRASRSYWESCSAVCSTGRSNSSSSSTGTTHLMQRDKSRMWQRMKEKERVAALSVVFIALKLLDFLEMCAFSLHLFVLPLVCHIQKAPFLALWLLHSDHPLHCVAISFYHSVSSSFSHFMLQRTHNYTTTIQKSDNGRGYSDNRPDLTPNFQDKHILDKLLPKRICHHPKWIGFRQWTWAHFKVLCSCLTMYTQSISGNSIIYTTRPLSPLQWRYLLFDDI